ncbi:protein FAR1-RELATED SEQUENCE 5-like [Rhododendron vialii]|uniref:protein FAR1-RELATED SEQUENCE 5-like n=1 Tax=Rhododendron vialii TaxID=182163 RepID=UPI00265DC4AD|nr:protein FAR1-RELATED SEQUENCE 5-like [Rhododendron vialii]
MSFVPFTGVNHHHQSRMFGCALLVNETAESYIWYYQILCIVYVCGISYKRFRNIWHVFNKYPTFQKEFRHCIQDTITIDQFEMEWNQLILNYELTENDWSRDLYRRQEKWIPAYLRTMFCVELSTTQRSDSMNKFFKDFVHSSMLVSDFVYQYEKALDKRYQSKKEKDVKMRTTKAILKTCYKMEVQFCEDGTTKTSNVVAYGQENLVYEVVFDIVEKKAVCSCHKFGFIGILCRHILALFAKKSLASHLPEYYILQRWTINAKSHVANEISPTLMSQVTLQEGSKSSSTLTKHNLMIEVLKVVEERQKSQKKHDHLISPCFIEGAL